MVATNRLYIKGVAFLLKNGANPYLKSGPNSLFPQGKTARERLRELLKTFKSNYNQELYKKAFLTDQIFQTMGQSKSANKIKFKLQSVFN